MNIFNLFVKNKPPRSDYVANPEEYLAQKQIPPNLRSFYSHIKITFLFLFPLGFALSLIPVYFFLIAAVLSFLIGFYYLPDYEELFITKLKFFVFMVIPPFCLSSGFVFALALFSQIAKITGN